MEKLETNYCSMELDQIYELFHSDPKSGLKEQEGEKD